MDKVVTTGMKIDLHIHSVESAGKDGAKVKNNTIENVPLLIGKLNENQVNICAITDHDTFSYDMYAALKQAEEQDNSIKKVLPGVEFSVCFNAENKESVIHVVTIFSDEDDERVKNIQKVMAQFSPDYNGAYREETFLGLLREINLNTILIAHQKNTLTSAKPRKNDANSLGNKKFLEFVYTNYFEAFEFKNRRNEVINKNYLVEKDLEEDICFVTGTDCHDWSVYPAETPSDTLEEDFPYTYAKCLPTFKGLVMAITDHTRLRAVDSFFSADKSFLEAIELSHGNEKIKIPLSKGINVIIGDNSIGKSMLLHALTGYKKSGAQLQSAVKTGYKKYLSSLDLAVQPQIKKEKIFAFDMQGEVRSKFEENKLSGVDFLGQYFPKPVDSSRYRGIVESEITRMINYLEKKFKLDLLIESLGPITIEPDNTQPDSLTFINNLNKAKIKTNQLIEIVDQIEKLIQKTDELLCYQIDESDLEYVKRTKMAFQSMKEKYERKISDAEMHNARIEVISKTIKTVTKKHNRSIGDAQKRYSLFTEKTEELKGQIVDILCQRDSMEPYQPKILSTKVIPNSEIVYDYEFISKLQVDEINTGYYSSLIQRTLKAGKHINWESITERQLGEMLLKHSDEPVIPFFKDALNAIMDSDFSPKNSIIYQGQDKYSEMSSGFDAKIYFEILSYETQHDGIYLIDQPEDNISQAAIRDYVLEGFKTMGENRQIIMVTHNPQFIVNLDIDNLIYLSKSENSLQVQSGALEYTCPEYDILDIVAKNIDGGLDSIQKRWKRYEKATAIYE